MTTYNTGNPIGSTDPKDLYDNAQSLDQAVNSAETTFTDRLGQVRKTYKGIELDAAGFATDAAASASEAAGSASSASASAAGAAASADAAEAAAEASALNLESDPENIQMDGIQAAGSLGKAARSDHVHPTDTSREPARQMATQAEMEAGTETAVRSMSPAGVAQAIAAQVQPPANPYVGGRGQVFTATGNFTVPDGITAVKVRGCAGGSGSTNGGTTSFGTYCSATGGATSGGTATGGDINLTGGSGANTGNTAGATASGGACGGASGSSASGILGGAVGTSKDSSATGYGNGGGATYSSTIRRSGSGGGYFEAYLTGLTPGQVIPVTIGAGGGGADPYSAGSPGIVIVEW